MLFLLTLDLLSRFWKSKCFSKKKKTFWRLGNGPVDIIWKAPDEKWIGQLQYWRCLPLDQTNRASFIMSVAWRRTRPAPPRKAADKATRLYRLIIQQVLSARPDGHRFPFSASKKMAVIQHLTGLPMLSLSSLTRSLIVSVTLFSEILNNELELRLFIRQFGNGAPVNFAVTVTQRLTWTNPLRCTGSHVTVSTVILIINELSAVRSHRGLFFFVIDSVAV